MTLPKDVQSALDCAMDFVRPYNNARVDRSLQTLSAHLLSQDAEIVRLQAENNQLWQAVGTPMPSDALRSRLAAADALLRRFIAVVRDTAFKIPPPNQWTPAFVALSQEAERQAQLLEASHDRA